ncbi:MAG: hypothetical protein K0V04_20125 [Deltaproteobacteria bacterium]|nr:hypothetical protein [Deltaproteobacteria bacterium]
MRRLYLLSCLPLALACNGSDSGREGDGGGVVSISVGEGGTAPAETDDATAGSGSGSAEGTGNADGTVDDDGDGGGGLPSFDVGAPAGEGGCGGGMGGGTGTLSYNWIANSAQGTVTKINTQSMVEEGRYVVRPDGAGSPSRTSVSLSGDVGVASRNGGATKIYGNIEDCQESNGMPGIQTATDAAYLPWGQDECIAWHTPLVYTSNRPMAWAQGDWNDVTCEYDNEMLWTSGRNGGAATEVLLLDGETGAVTQTVVIPEIGSGIGLYGGAVDGDGNFWGIDRSGAYNLIRVDRQTFQYEVIPGPGAGGYGLAVDSTGRPWYCAGGGAWRYEPGPGTWQSVPSPGGNLWGGCMTDGQGTLWHCRQQDSTLVGIDTETFQIVDQIPIPSYAHGISIDFDGNVWAVGFSSNVAYRVDPVTHTIDTFDQLVGAYTYSDMTGFALASVGTPSG